MKQKLMDQLPCFIPVWTSAINFAQLTNNKRQQTIQQFIGDKFNLNYSEPKACLVGEAHVQLGKGSESKYCSTITSKQQCTKCENLCGDPAELAVNRGGDTLIKFKVKLYNHMVEKHGFKGNVIDPKKIPKISSC